MDQLSNDWFHVLGELFVLVAENVHRQGAAHGPLWVPLQIHREHKAAILCPVPPQRVGVRRCALVENGRCAVITGQIGEKGVLLPQMVIYRLFDHFLPPLK